MTEPRDPRPSAQVDNICDLFESAWRTGQRPRTEDYLKRVDPSIRPQLLGQLLMSEWDQRREAQESVDVDAYVSRFREYADIVQATYRRWQVEMLSGIEIGQPHYDHRREPSESVSTVAKGDSSTVHGQFLPGTTLAGRYRIVSLLGKGGMGAVYRADDLKLGHTVALKFLPESLGADQRRLQCFHSEVRLSRQISHPNICRVYDIGEVDGQHFLSMEYIDGEDLKRLLQRIGRLPKGKATETAAQLCAGLAAAHECGVLHRDLKPANVMLDGRGRVRITDFGLARIQGERVGDDEFAGTPAYMAPEQLLRGETSVKSDIYSLGTVLYQIFVGRPLHDGLSIPELQKLHEQDTGIAHPSRSVEDIDPQVEAVILKCLARDPRERPDSAATVASALPSDANVNLSLHPPSGTAHSKRRVNRILYASVISLTAIIAAAVSWVIKPSSPVVPSVRAVTVVLDSAAPILRDASDNAFAISGDGKSLAYSTTTGLHLMALDRFDSKEILRGANGNAFFSPDNQWIGFVSNVGQQNQLNKIHVAGGNPQKVCSVGGVRGATWGVHGEIVFGVVWDGLKIVREGVVTSLTELNNGEWSHRWPCFLPDGRHVLFSVYVRAIKDVGEIHVVDIQTGERHIVSDKVIGTYPRYSTSGHLLYRSRDTIYAVPFDLKTMRAVDTPSIVLSNVRGREDTGSAQFDVSQDGTLVYLKGPVGDVEGGRHRSLVWIDSNGLPVDATQKRMDYSGGAAGWSGRSPRLSPDGKRVAVHVRHQDDNLDVCVIDLVRNTNHRVTLRSNDDMTPIWTPDGGSLAFRSSRNGVIGIYMKRIGDDSPPKCLIESPLLMMIVPEAFSPDGRFLVYSLGTRTADSGKTDWNLWYVPMEGDRKPRLLSWPQSPRFSESDLRFSPDGNWIAYVSNESGEYQVFVRASHSFPTLGPRNLVSGGDGYDPRWSHDGTRLFFQRGNAIMSAPISGNDTAIAIGDPVEEFMMDATYVSGHYDVSPIDSRILAIRKDVQAHQAIEQPPVVDPSYTINVEFNWTQKLRQN